MANAVGATAPPTIWIQDAHVSSLKTVRPVAVPNHLRPPGWSAGEICALMKHVTDELQNLPTSTGLFDDPFEAFTRQNIKKYGTEGLTYNQMYTAPMPSLMNQCGFEAAAHLLFWIRAYRRSVDHDYWDITDRAFADDVRHFLTDDDLSRKAANWTRIYHGLPPRLTDRTAEWDVAWRTIADGCALTSFFYLNVNTCAGCKHYSATEPTMTSVFKLEDFMLGKPNGAQSADPLEDFFWKFFGVHTWPDLKGMPRCPGCGDLYNTQVVAVTRLPLEMMLSYGGSDFDLGTLQRGCRDVNVQCWDNDGAIGFLSFERLSGIIISNDLHIQAALVGTGSSGQIFMHDWSRFSAEVMGRGPDNKVRTSTRWDDVVEFQGAALRRDRDAGRLARKKDRRVAGVMLRRQILG